MAKVAEVAAFMNEVYAKFDKRITDYIFLTIEKDEVLQKKYRQLFNDDKEQGTVNQLIGKQVKEHFDLENVEKAGRENNPEADLIDSHQRFK